MVSIDVLRQTLDLMNTCLEGVDYIIGKTRDESYEVGLPLLTDVVSAFNSIENLYDQSLAVINTPEVVQAFATVVATLDILVGCCEKGEWDDALLRTIALRTDIERWIQVSGACYRPYLLS